MLRDVAHRRRESAEFVVHVVKPEPQTQPMATASTSPKRHRRPVNLEELSPDPDSKMPGHYSTSSVTRLAREGSEVDSLAMGSESSLGSKTFRNKSLSDVYSSTSSSDHSETSAEPSPRYVKKGWHRLHIDVSNEDLSPLGSARTSAAPSRKASPIEEHVITDLAAVPVDQSYAVVGTGNLLVNGFEISPYGVTKTPDPRKRRGSTTERSPVALGMRMSANDFVRISALGAGQNGTVYKAMHMKELAVMALKPVNIYDKSKRHQMLSELEAFMTLKCKYVANFIGAYIEDGNTLVMALEYMNRGSLQQAVQKHGPLDESTIRWIALRVTKGLRYLHKHHQVHRDIKPDNILLSHDGEVKISDFGLTKQLQSSVDLCKSFVGTMSYLSPERIRGNQFSYPADIWSLGITLYYCATGRLPLPHDYWALVNSLTQDKIPKLDASQFSPDLCDFVAKCLREKPHERATTSELLRHPFLAQTQDFKVTWPFLEPSDRDVEDLNFICDVLAEKFYPDGTFRETLLDRERFKHVGKQLGFSRNQVREAFLSRLKLRSAAASLAPTPLAAPVGVE